MVWFSTNCKASCVLTATVPRPIRPASLWPGHHRLAQLINIWRRHLAQTVKFFMPELFNPKIYILNAGWSLMKLPVPDVHTPEFCAAGQALVPVQIRFRYHGRARGRASGSRLLRLR